MQTADSITTFKASETNLNQVIELVNKTKEPIVIKGDGHPVVVIPLEEWEAIEETLYLNSIPGYVETFNKAANSPKEELVDARDLGLL